MKRSLTLWIAVLLLFTVAVSADGATGAGTASDPLITLSYVNEILKPQIIAEAKAQLAAELRSQIMAELKPQIIAEVLAALDGTGDIGDVTSAYTVVYLRIGQRLMATDACEIILRSGSCSAVVLLPENIANGVGLSDLTAGREITTGQAVPPNHYIVIPRGDGRGVSVTSLAGGYFMVRGGYEIVG